MKPLSKSQQAIFNFLKQCADEGRTPSVREICEATGLKSTSTVHHHLSALEEKGLIEREHGLNRYLFRIRVFSALAVKYRSSDA